MADTDKARLPAPPYGREIDLTRFPKMPLDVSRLADSKFTATVGPESWKIAVLLWAKSWHQIPAGSLPGDDEHLAHLAGYKGRARAWKRVKEGGALYGWRMCADGRLYHPTVSEMVAEAWIYTQQKVQAGIKGGHAKAKKDRAAGRAEAPLPEQFPESFDGVSAKFEKVSTEFAGNSLQTQEQNSTKSMGDVWQRHGKEQNRTERKESTTTVEDARATSPSPEPSQTQEPAAGAAGGGGRLAEGSEISFADQVAEALGADPDKSPKWAMAGMEAGAWKRSGLSEAQIVRFAKAEGARIRQRGALPPDGPRWFTVALQNALRQPSRAAEIQAPTPQPKRSDAEMAAIRREAEARRDAEAAAREAQNAAALAALRASPRHAAH